MRTLTFYFFLQTFLVNISFAQSPFVNKDSIKINNITYLCFSGYGSTEVNNKNHSTSSITYVSGIISEYCEDADVKDDVLEASIAISFTPNRRLLLRNSGVRVVVYVKPTTGVIEEVKFSIPTSSPMTLEEVYTLEQNLKGKVMNLQPYCAPMKFTALSISL